ncbi:MAG: aminotransferase class V-fold PLP-dependent enzyme [Anaerolineae bacterium]
MLIPQSKFTGLENITHLATGGESPALKSHQDAVAQFFAAKAKGEDCRYEIEATYERAQAKVAQLLNVNADEIAFLSSATDGINTLAYSIDWQAGDNVVVSDVEFPSDVLVWTQFEKLGVEVRVVRHVDWQIRPEDIAAQIDDRTRVVAISYVSYFTGQRQNLAALSAVVRQSKAIFLVDATHAAGVVAVDAHYADVLVSSCYKWMLATHGTAIFYWNKKRLPDLKPPFIGWATPESLPGWEDPTAYTLPDHAGRFVPANPSFISIYVLENALDHLLEVGRDTIEEYVLSLSGRLWQGVSERGWEMLTPAAADQRAGNICFMAPNIDEVVGRLKENNILIWGSYGGVKRVRVSTHLYNTAADVDKFLEVVGSAVG